MKVKSLLASLLVISAFVSIPAILNAQGPGDPGPDPDPNPPKNSAPFDGGLSLMIAAGVGIASKKALDKKRKSKNNIIIDKSI